MFRINQNDFLTQGRVTYIDDCGNTAFFKRDADKPFKFVGKIRFANKNVSAEPMYVEVPIPDGTLGDTLRMKYKDGIDHHLDADIAEGIDGFTVLVNRWIDIMYDIIHSTIDQNMLIGYLKDSAPGLTDEDVAREKMSRLSLYEELHPAIKAAFGGEAEQE
jgi:hypothetical protein